MSNKRTKVALSVLAFIALGLSAYLVSQSTLFKGGLIASQTAATANWSTNIVETKDAAGIADDQILIGDEIGFTVKDFKTIYVKASAGSIAEADISVIGYTTNPSSETDREATFLAGDTWISLDSKDTISFTADAEGIFDIYYCQSIICPPSIVTAPSETFKINEVPTEPTSIDFTLSLSSSSIKEGDGSVGLTVTASSAVPENTPVNLTFSGSAGDKDYSIDAIGSSSFSTTITIPTGQTSVMKKIAVIDDALVESTEQLRIGIEETFAGPSPSTLPSVYVTLTILDNDVAQGLSTVSYDLSSESIKEKGGEATLTATLSDALKDDLLIKLSFSGTASSSDYNVSSDSILILNGQTKGSIVISAVNDGIKENDETISFQTQSNQSKIPSSKFAFSDFKGTVTIKDDDGSSGSSGGSSSGGRRSSSNDDECGADFDDTKDIRDDELCSAIKWSNEEDIFTGYPDGTFKPNNQINRAELVKVLMEAFDVPSRDATLSFSDVSRSGWYASYLKTALANGIVSGDRGKNTFRPGDYVNRAESLRMVFETLRVADSFTIPNCMVSSYEDVAKTAWYNDYACLSKKYGDLFNLFRNVYFIADTQATRGEIALVLFRLHEQEIVD